MTTNATRLLKAAAPLEADHAARATWTAIAEPNNPTVGQLIAAHGPAVALDVILDGAPTDVEGVDVLRDHATPRATPSAIARAIRAAEQTGAELITPDSPEWPRQLDDLGDTSPVALWVRGTPSTLTAPRITALTGSRAASTYGEFVALELANALMARGHTLVAGGAYGVDAQTHRAALAANHPGIAVMAGGLSRFYPAGHNDLLTRVAGNGVVISENAPELVV